MTHTRKEVFSMKQRLKQEYTAVDMPTTGVSKKKVGKYLYVYHIGKGYRNDKGQPTNDKTCIGKVNENTGMLIPNDNYFEIYGGEPEVEIKVDAILNYGNYYLLNLVSEELGLNKVIKNVFGEEDGSRILLLAIYMALTGDPNYRCEGWCRETLVDQVLMPFQITRLFERIDEVQRMEFFKAWVNVRKQHEYFALDVTSISSYARGNALVEYGYNRDHEALPQLNLGMYYGEESKLPIFYDIYKGSIVDKSELQHMMKYNDRLGIKDANFVMDRGFYTEDNIKDMAFMHRFIIGVSNSLALAKEIIEKYGDKVQSSRYDIKNEEATGMKIEDNRYGFRSHIMLYHSLEKKAGERDIFKAKLDKWEELLKEGKTFDAANDFFNVTEEQVGDEIVYTVTRKHEEIDKETNNLGFFLMMTTDLRKTPEEVLRIYRLKDLVEKIFDVLKNQVDANRLRTHSEETSEGKIFVTFISLIFLSHIHNILREFQFKKKISLDQIFDELRMIKVVKIKDGMLISNHITKKQRTILEFFNVDVKKIEDSLKKYDTIPDFYLED